MFNDPKLRKLWLFIISPILFVLIFILIPILASGNAASLKDGVGQMLFGVIVLGAIALSVIFSLVVWLARLLATKGAPSSSAGANTQTRQTLYNVAWILIALNILHLILEGFNITQLENFSLKLIKDLLSLTFYGIIFAFAIGLNGVLKEKISANRLQCAAIFLASAACWFISFNF